MSALKKKKSNRAKNWVGRATQIRNLFVDGLNDRFNSCSICATMLVFQPGCSVWVTQNTVLIFSIGSCMNETVSNLSLENWNFAVGLTCSSEQKWTSVIEHYYMYIYGICYWDGGLEVSGFWTTMMRRQGVILTDLWPPMTCILSGTWLCSHIFTLALMMTIAFSRNVGKKLFSELKW